MIDFSTLKELTIPEGNVTQITDASGNVLWKQAPSGVPITLSFTRQGAASFYTYASITVDGVSYPTVDNQLNLPTEEIIVPIGSVITCKVAGNVGTPQIKLNGKTVASGNNKEYQYTVVGEATIAASIARSFTPQTGTQPYGTISITEL